MMATVPLSTSSLLPLLECLEDEKAGQSEQTDAYLTIANRLSGEDGRQFLPVIVKHFSRLGETLQTHISSENVELSLAALQALGFCMFNTHIVAGIPEKFSEEILSALASLVVKSSDKNICTRALWVISKQNFPSEVVAKKTPEILKTLEAVRTRDVQSIVMEHEALNAVIRLLEQAPAQMGEGAVSWAKLVIPLVVHSASKVRLRAAAALEIGMPLLLEKQQEIAAIIEPIMSTKIIPELQKLFSSKNETNVLKLWPLFVKLLGKLLHRGGSFINSLLYLEELGFRSSSPSVKKIAFIAWKSLIDNFALNPDILCSTKRLKLLMQPLSSIHVRTEALMLTKLEVWWYLVVKLGPNLAANFEQVGVPLLHSTISSDSAVPSPSTPARATAQNSVTGAATPKSGVSPGNTSACTPRINLNSSVHAGSQAYPSIQILGLEMLLHYFLGPEVTSAVAKNKLQLSLEPLVHPLLSTPSAFGKYSSVLISAVRDGFIAIGKDAPDALLFLIWKSLVGFVSTSIEAGNKKERQGSEVLTLLLQALQSIVCSEAMPAPQALALLEITVKGIPQKVLGSAAYQVANMDVLNGTPALFLILLFYNSSMLSSFVVDERFFLCLETLVSSGLSGPTSPLAFGEAVLGAIGHSVGSVENKEHLWRMWSVVVNPLTDIITQTNEVNQGDALEHNFSAIHSALMFPITHLLHGTGLPQMTQKSMLSTWSKLYKTFARCSALVATAEENICCEELCGKMSAILDSKALKNLSTLEAVISVLQIIIESVDFSPYTSQFQQKMKSPRTPLGWTRKRNKALGNLTTFNALLVQSLEAFLGLELQQTPAAVAGAVIGGFISILSTLFINLALPTVIQEALSSLIQPLALLYGQVGSLENEQSKSLSALGPKLEKFLGELFSCLQTRAALQYDDELLALLSPLLCVLFPHGSKQVRTLVTQFWNATFGNTLVLTYPEKLKPILSQVKQKTPIILPGFQAIQAPDDHSGPYSNDSSQLETNVSGVTVASVGKRDSLLARAVELKDKNSGTPSKPVSVKLDFGSPKPPRKEVLEEESCTDFVFIPPETKERVLTEHQKEVKRTKRVDIPAMYNNLDASLDTTVFTQYTQSQEESMELPAADQAKGSENGIDTRDTKTIPDTKKSVDVIQVQDCSIPVDRMIIEATERENERTEQLPLPADVSVENITEQDDSDLQPRDENSPNVSGSSDVISGTPQKPNSRRQSFITLEKYTEGKPASPASVTKFTGPLTKSSGSQEPPNSSSPSPHDPTGSQTEVVSGLPQDTAKNDITQESSDKSQREEAECVTELKANKPSGEGLEDEDDIIPDTQTQVLGGASNSVISPTEDDEVQVTESGASPVEENSEALVNSEASSQGELRRSGRRRSRPLYPGEDPEQQEAKFKSLGVGLKSPDVSLAESQKTTPAQTDTMLQGRSTRRNKLSVGADKNENDQPQKRYPSRESKHSQSNSQTESASSQTDSQSHGRPGRRSKIVSDSQEDSTKDKNQTTVAPQSNSQISKSPASTQKDGHLPTSDLDTETNSQSQGRPRRTRRSEATETPDRDKLSEGDKKDPLSQTESQPLESTPSSRDRLGKKRKIEEGIKSSQNSSSISVDSDCSQTDDVDKTDSSQQQRRYPQTRRSSQGLLTTVGNSQLDASDSGKDGQKPSKRGRKPKTLLAVIAAPLSDVQVSESGKANKDASSEVLMEVTESSQKVEPEVSVGDCAINEAEAKVSSPEAGDKKVISAIEESDVAQSMGETESEKDEKTDSAVSNASVLEKSEAESTKPVPQDVHTESDEVKLKNQTLQKCPHAYKGRGRRRSKPCGCQHNSVSSQEKDYSGSETTQDVEDDRISLEQKKLPSETELDNCTSDPSSQEKELSVADDSPAPVTNALCTPLSSSPLPENESLETLSTEKEHEKCIVKTSQHLEKETPVEPTHDKVESADVLNQNIVEHMEQKENQQESENSFEEHQEMEQDISPRQEAPQHSFVEDNDPAEVTASGQHKSEQHILTCEEQLQSPLVDQAREVEDLSAKDTEEPAVSEVKDVVPSTNEDAPSLEGIQTDSAPVNINGDEGEDTQIDNELPVGAAATATGPSDEVSVPIQATSEDACLDSPPKKKSLDGVCGEPEVVQSPSSGRTRGVWSPSASPSTSILKKGQKRSFEEESPSPLLKSRRVSFANPIYHQEIADDIDRRSPIIRSSSPRSKNINAQPKYVSTPTKGLLNFSPRNLRSPGYKSSKKCLISEMSQEPRPIPKDCVYPALVCCSTPVEAVLPQISSNIWPRGFGQLVRAKNIKTVGDLSALTPSEIKSLPIRSPKLANVKKALQIYHEQQQKGRSDDLKSFDETEKMTAEPEEIEEPQNQEEEQISEEPQELSSDAPAAVEQRTEMHRNTELLSDVEALGARFTPEELGSCSPGQLTLMHECLSGMMKSIVVQLQSRLTNQVECLP